MYARVMLNELGWMSFPSASFVSGEACWVKSAKIVAPILKVGVNAGGFGASSAIAATENIRSKRVPSGIRMGLPFEFRTVRRQSVRRAEADERRRGAFRNGRERASRAGRDGVPDDSPPRPSFRD